MKILKRIIFVIILLCPVSLFAQQPVPTIEMLQIQLDSTFWESNYCKQRAIVLQIQAQEIQKQIQKLKIEEKKGIPEKEEVDE